ncbi:hypothetical protein XENTR_v10009551 [Xenopus tropicalis]|nr:hypothetical protein XENTR_v10009551 [Xenopus tropicalis]
MRTRLGVPVPYRTPKTLPGNPVLAALPAPVSTKRRSVKLGRKRIGRQIQLCSNKPVDTAPPPPPISRGHTAGWAMSPQWGRSPRQIGFHRLSSRCCTQLRTLRLAPKAL